MRKADYTEALELLKWQIRVLFEERHDTGSVRAEAEERARTRSYIAAIRLLRKAQEGGG